MAGILTFPITYRGLVLNGQYSAAGVYQKANELDCYIVERFDFSRLQVRDQREGLHLDSGGLLGPATKQFRILSLMGSIRASTPEQLEDMVAEFNAAFDIEEAQVAEPFYRGVNALDFYTPTELAGYSNPLREMFLARPIGFPSITERRTTGTTAAYSVELACPDPRRYRYDITQQSFSAGAGWSHALPNYGAGVGVETIPYVLVNLSGPGASNFTITDSVTGKSFVLDLSGQTADIAIDFQSMEIYRNSDGARRDNLRTSGVASWLHVPSQGTTWSMANTTGIVEVLVGYRQARS